MAATRVLKTLDIYRQEGCGGMKWNRDPGEEATQTFKKGAPLVEDASSAEVEIWAGGTDATQILGIAAADATGTTGADVPYYEANQYNIFQGSVVNGTDAIALAASHINGKYSLVASGNDWYIDVSDTNTDKVQIIAPIDDIGDTNARVQFRFLSNMQIKNLAAD